MEALDDQIDAMTSEQDFKQQQLPTKIRQTEYKLASDLADMEQAYFQDSVSVVQYNRTAQLLSGASNPVVT